jgi:hypothetical protein
MAFDKVLALFKFGKREHIEQFVYDGLIYMNSASYFRSLEKDTVRKDKHENASHSLQADGATLRVEKDGKWIDIGTIKGPIVSSDGSDRDTNVFCMYAFRESASKSLIDPRNFEFGDTYAILKDADEFLRRVRETAKTENIVLKLGLVEYVDRTTYNGKIGVFRKFSEFAYQSEFRLAVVTGKEMPFSFRIGDISDISMIGTLAEVNERIRISKK